MPTSSVKRALYRARQLVAALRPRIEPRERAEARALLGERLFPLFLSMSVRDQRHCLDVCQALQARGCDDRELLAAALLHDVGKGRLAGSPVRLWHRVAYVVLAAVAPSLLGRWAGEGGLAVLHRHPERGACLAAAAGAAPAVVELIRRHEEGEGAADPRLRLLRAADDSC